MKNANWTWENKFVSSVLHVQFALKFCSTQLGLGVPETGRRFFGFPTAQV